ncbi:MAG: dTDP-4-dehydrorhamnose reductase [Hyphomonas sp.]|nr:dTDP-4-dehydrorhamnose reductase [Hyphomonas sp.]
MTRCLVIGKHGQVAQALAAVGGADVYAASREETDLRDADTLRRALDRHRPAFVINAGGFTKVDAAESEPDEAQALNVTGPEALARACSDAGAVLIHLSTDCVFDGRKASPYLASEVPNPLGVYGRTKLEGEQAVLAAVPQSLVVRVSWVFSRYAGNFVRTMLTAAQKRPVVTVVSDQIGGPTYAPDLARALLNMGEQAAEPGFAGWGLYHLAGDDTIGRADMARRIFEVSARLGGPVAEVTDILTADFPTPAERPLNARLDMRETARVFGVEIPDWMPGLETTVKALIAELAPPGQGAGKAG